MPLYPKDISGQKFGRLLAITENGKSNRGITTWLCRCDCGNIVTVRGSSLRNGTTKSCGCLRKELTAQNHTFHGFRNTRLYNIYRNMKARCYNPHTPCYKYYGGLGITLCDEWLHNFEPFMEWSLSHGYAENLTIDRIDNAKGYSPDNCRWITIQEQQKNRRKRGTVLCQ